MTVDEAEFACCVQTSGVGSGVTNKKRGGIAPAAPSFFHSLVQALGAP
jgi:hypothetical protein